MKGKDIVDLLKTRIQTHWKAISLDGSAFDSSQFECLMRLVDDRFWKGMRPFVRKVIQHNWEGMINAPINSVDRITDQLMKSLLKSQNLVFVKLPGVKSPTWPATIRKQFFRDVEQACLWRDPGPELDWIYLELNGTTFSGHSTKTTLGNTLRTLCYAWFYVKKAGISDEPWKSKELFAIASGDDCVIFVAPEHADLLYSTILELSARNTRSQCVGLGQCIKEIQIGKFYDIEFCSKWSDSPDGTLENWSMCRSVKKLMTTKQYFTGKNKHILNDPWLHRKAILEGFESEKISRLIEDMLRVQLERLKRPDITAECLDAKLRQTKQIQYA